MMRRAVAFRGREPLLRKGWGLLLLGVVTAGGCAYETHIEYPEDLYHPNYVKRSKAVAEFARRKDKSQLPQAFELLLDEDANIRLVAHETIRELTPDHDDKGYRPYLPLELRYAIVVRWQAAWIYNTGGGAGAEADAEPATEAEVEPPPEVDEPGPAEESGHG